jgi:hypothetical protein
MRPLSTTLGDDMATEPEKKRKPLNSLWRVDAIGRAEELELHLRRMSADPDKDLSADAVEHLIDAVNANLADARYAAGSSVPLHSRFRGLVSGAPIQSAMFHLDSAEINLFRLAKLDYLESKLPNLIATSAEVLPSEDERLRRLIELGERVEGPAELKPAEKTAAVAAISAAKKAVLQAQGRVRAFRNVILVATTLALLVGIVLALVGLFAPETIPLCQYDPGLDAVTCPASGNSPQPADTLIVQFAGLMGATVAAVFALRKVRGTTDPYSVPMALAILKLPTGALTAVLGLLLIRGGFVPGLTGLDSAAQIIGWAIIFGYAQELFTQLVDRQAAAVLSASPASRPAKPQDRTGQDRTIGGPADMSL